jgi:hypothetical protein
MSLIVLAMFFIGFAMFGVPHREPDEGAAAHLFQIWLAVEVLMVAFFAIKWLPLAPTQALLIARSFRAGRLITIWRVGWAGIPLPLLACPCRRPDSGN